MTDRTQTIGDRAGFSCRRQDDCWYPQCSCPQKPVTGKIAPTQTTKPSGYPASIDNPDDWAGFLSRYLDNRATSAAHNGIGLVALHIADAVAASFKAGYAGGRKSMNGLN